MDDPLFDPWGEDPETAPAPAPPPTSKAPKWRSTAGPGARPPAPRVPPQRRASAPPPRARLAGTPGFLRSMAAPRLHEIARRLEIARHEAIVEDDLEGLRPALRLRFLPWRGPFGSEPGLGWETLEVALEDGPEERVVACHWSDATEGAPEPLDSVPAGKLGAAWLEAVALSFVTTVLGRA